MRNAVGRAWRFSTCAGLTCLCFLAGCGNDGPGRNGSAPTARELGESALASEFIVESSDVDCVGRIIRESDLSDQTLDLVVRGGLSQTSDLLPVSEGSDLQLALIDIEDEMLEACGVHSWPKVDRWPGDPDRMY